MNAQVRRALKRAVGPSGLAVCRRVSSWRRDVATERLVGDRLATANNRLLPNAIILGAQKAGTSTFFDLLARHPLILTSFIKEVHFFDLQLSRGIDWYRAHFPLMCEYEKLASASVQPVVLEASPYYLFHPAVPQRTAQALPQARLIVLLRDPVARAWSHYWHERTRGYEWLSPRTAFERELDRLAGEEERLLADPNYRSHAHRHFSYLSRSSYAAQLERWFAHFPREQVLVLRSEDLFASTTPIVAQTIRFLGLPHPTEPVPLPRDSARNIGHYGKLSAPLKEWLQIQLKPSNAALQTLFGPAFAW